MSESDREAIFTALADPCRRLILTRLQARNGQTLSQLCDGLTISRQAVTKHLKQLETANLVLSEKSGRERLHFLNPVPLRAVAIRWLERFDATPMGTLAQRRKSAR
ncbi:transcriptional regulator [Youhaiella tibetensis]|uniref:Helix-turn-helix transcriptional regulator n=1 Tax=Paradevosia tibetensis TaxID=1447062 RepID=A0A5B9DT38_9HYPH|nr:metalloregulator ArsR/SmtB family transcription factor [Youhaiella tibetensis]AKR56470.1 ArsR family transcriptional regulator [Devosia sp. H5989]QEE21514.1 helix-turn-helix transcriptional regulator [Youhaiella tibetensis]GGF14309.1 transcriptional regulator [Youhaiella tibetensis]